MKRLTFRPEDLRVVGHVPPPDDPPLGIGDWCRLNSGGPKMLVVDLDAETVTIVEQMSLMTVEWTVPRVCVRRASVAE